MKTLKYRLLSQLIALVFLAGCSQTSIVPVVSTTEPAAPPTVIPSPVSSITPSPTLQYMGSILTAAAIVQQTRTAPFTQLCTPPSFDYPPIDIPETENFSWQDYQSPVGKFQRLAGLTTAIMSIDPSPSGHWAIISLLYQEHGYGAYSAFLFMLDSSGNQHWVISEDESDKNTYRWLPDNRIIWIDDGELFIANEDGSNRHGLQAPASVYEVWVGANDIALVSGAEDLWRFSINNEIWEKVANVGGVSIPSANLNLSMDGTFVAVNIQGEISIVPLQKGTPAQTFVKVD
jgi:hypothetical protein